jgi:hypothetical protein
LTEARAAAGSASCWSTKEGEATGREEGSAIRLIPRKQIGGMILYCCMLFLYNSECTNMEGNNSPLI